MSRSRFFFLLSTLIALYHLVIAAQIPAFLGYFVPQQMHKAISLFCALFLVFTLVPLTGLRRGEHDEAERVERRVPWYDYVLIASAAAGAGYVVFFYESMLDYGEWGFLDTKGIVLALMLAIPLLEAVRRTIGSILVNDYHTVTGYHRTAAGVVDQPVSLVANRDRSGQKGRRGQGAGPQQQARQGQPG